MGGRVAEEWDSGAQSHRPISHMRAHTGRGRTHARTPEDEDEVQSAKARLVGKMWWKWGDENRQRGVDAEWG